jgi:N-acetylglucosaminyldiphosphoundecaprenol N-acetyl-beta-D-mannosaminyltransferase
MISELWSEREYRANVLGLGISVLNLQRAVHMLLHDRKKNLSGYVCVTGAHGVIESQYDDELRKIHNNSYLTVPDGMPTVWMGMEQGYVDMGRVYGPDLMLEIMRETCSLGKHPSLTHFLFGATDDILMKMKQNFEAKFPHIKIVGMYAPPFRALNDEEEHELAMLVQKLKPDFFWVGLSTPKQEKFMAAHAHNSNFGMMLGVGAAFLIHAGLQKDAPNWIKNSGFHWFYRLCQEPRRLWRRYVKIVPTFLWLAFLQLLGLKRYTAVK